jgi:predicted lipid-binding transport protein (Tim44 family)
MFSALSGKGGFPVDIILFGMIAVFLVLRLRSVLGRRGGFEPPPGAPKGLPPATKPSGFAALRRAVQGIAGQGAAGAGLGQTIEGKAEPAMPGAVPGQAMARGEPVATSRVLPDPASACGQSLQALREADRGFDPARFLDTAEANFRVIVAAYAAGERDRLRPLLTDEAFAAFDAAIAARTAAGETLRCELRAISSIGIDAVERRGSIGEITVRIVSDQINVTTGADGLPVAGADAVTEIVDLWHFERDFDAAAPLWRLAGTRSG